VGALRTGGRPATPGGVQSRVRVPARRR
jgi:hypothetical protein